MRISLFLLKIRHLIFFTCMPYPLPILIAAVPCLCLALYLLSGYIVGSIALGGTIFVCCGVILSELYSGMLYSMSREFFAYSNSVRELNKNGVDIIDARRINEYCDRLNRCGAILDNQNELISTRIARLKWVLLGNNCAPARQLAKSKLEKAKEELRQEEAKLWSLIKSITENEKALAAPAAV